MERRAAVREGARKKGGKKRETGTRRRRNIQATLGEHTGDRRARARYGARKREMWSQEAVEVEEE